MARSVVSEYVTKMKEAIATGQTAFKAKFPEELSAGVSSNAPGKRQAPLPPLTKTQFKDIQLAFGLFDIHMTGILPEKEAISALKVTLRAIGKDLTDNDAYKLLQHLPKSSGCLTMDFKEFYKIIKDQMLCDDSPEELEQIFGQFSTTRCVNISFAALVQELCRDNKSKSSGKNPTSNDPDSINLENLKAISEELHSDIGEEELQAMISWASNDNQCNTISLSQFKKIMKRPMLED